MDDDAARLDDDVAVSATQVYLDHRTLLFTIAYEMLGSAADAEDVVQEVWLRWHEVDPSGVRDPRAYLARITTRQALNRLRTMNRRRETYVGPWLPEPLLTAPDVAQDAELAESVSMALMWVLETLTPTERAVFVLREVFEFDYDQIAAAVDKTPAAVRQIASRARRHVEERRPSETASVERSRAALESFRRAIATGDLQELLDVLAPDVVYVADGGGLKLAARQPVTGAAKVGGMILGVLSKNAIPFSVELRMVNARPALVVWMEDELDAVMSVRVEQGRISGIYYVRNPEKLSRLESVTALTRG